MQVTSYKRNIPDAEKTQEAERQIYPANETVGTSVAKPMDVKGINLTRH